MIPTNERMDQTPQRYRGIVWVCDVQDSTKLLNDDTTVNLLEEFLLRLYWVGTQITAAAQGVFIKWTGDGFMSWFETPLHRELGKKAAFVFNAAWQLTYLVNVTQLGLSSDGRITIRHGITFENDVLKIEIRNSDGPISVDLIGRDVVLAFRLSGIPVDFPRIVTQWTLVEAARKYLSETMHFEKLVLSDEDVLRFFKGERRALRSLYASSQRRKVPTTKSIQKQVTEAIAKAEPGESREDIASVFAEEYLNRLSDGPPWAKKIAIKLTEFTKEKLLSTLKVVVPVLNKLQNIE